MSVLRFDCRFRYPRGFELDFAFVAERGVTALVGPSGCGKTTVLNLIAGTSSPDSGEIAIGDDVIFESKRAKNFPTERRRIGYVFQDFQLFPHLNVRDNLRFGMLRTPSRAGNIDHVTDMLDLKNLLLRPPGTLSGGEQQRVALGRALLCSPRLLLLDEPLNALDVELRRNVAVYLRRVIDDVQIPCVLVSHDPESVATLADATFVMAGGRLDVTSTTGR
jgi:molybdate transport system ATP-binding protein